MCTVRKVIGKSRREEHELPDVVPSGVASLRVSGQLLPSFLTLGEKGETKIHTSRRRLRRILLMWR